MALAPTLPLLGVPSASSIAWSTRRWSSASSPSTTGARVSTTAATAFSTPLPAYRSPPSRSSTASKAPVDAPDGTAARAKVPSSRRTSTSTVGLPRESRISRAPTASIADTGALLGRWGRGPSASLVLVAAGRARCLVRTAGAGSAPAQWSPSGSPSGAPCCALSRRSVVAGAVTGEVLLGPGGDRLEGRRERLPRRGQLVGDGDRGTGID